MVENPKVIAKDIITKAATRVGRRREAFFGTDGRVVSVRRKGKKDATIRTWDPSIRLFQGTSEIYPYRELVIDRRSMHEKLGAMMIDSDAKVTDMKTFGTKDPLPIEQIEDKDTQVSIFERSKRGEAVQGRSFVYVPDLDEYAVLLDEAGSEVDVYGRDQSAVIEDLRLVDRFMFAVDGLVSKEEKEKTDMKREGWSAESALAFRRENTFTRGRLHVETLKVTEERRRVTAHVIVQDEFTTRRYYANNRANRLYVVIDGQIEGTSLGRMSDVNYLQSLVAA